MPLRIGFDLDGVFADMEGELRRHATVLFGPEAVFEAAARASGRTDADSSLDEPDDDRPPAHSNLTTNQQRMLWKHVRTVEGFWETLDETQPGSVRRLGDLSRARRWEIIFLTKRPETEGATAQVQSQRWLTAKGF